MRGVLMIASSSLAYLSLRFLPFAWQALDGMLLWLLLLLVGFVGTFGHYLLILGYGRTTPATLTPYLYSQIAFSTVAGWLVFSHAPDVYALAGILVITGCGIAGTWLSARTRRTIENYPVD